MPPPKRYELHLTRPRLSVGIKTLGALTAVFWIPIICLLTLLYFSFNDTLSKEALTSVRANLSAAKENYRQRPVLLENVLIRAVAHTNVRQSFAKKDSKQLQTLLLDLGNANNFVDIWIAVDSKQRVIARGGAKKGGDIVKIGTALSRAISSGDTVFTTELVTKEFLARENPSLTKRVEDTGVMQFVISPVNGGGAIVAGILLTGDTWLGNTVYDRLGAEVALFAGETPESALLHATSSEPRSTWSIGTRIPEEWKQELSLGRSYDGIINIDGKDNLIASVPIKDSKDRIIATLGVSQPTKRINIIVLKLIGMALLVSAIIAGVIALISTYFVRNDINKPINTLVAAMEAVGAGEIDSTVVLETGDEFEQLGHGFNTMARGIKEREERLKKHYEVAKLLMSTLDLKELLENILRVVMEVTESSMGVIYLEEDETELRPVVSYGTKADLPLLKMSEGYPGRAATERTTFVVAPPKGAEEAMMELGFTQAVPAQAAYVPLIHQDKVLGVLLLGSSVEFREEEKMLFEYLANQISIALDNAIMHHKIHELSIKDPLTKLYNRRYMNSRLEEEWSRAVRHGHSLSVILSDIDNFKLVNDTYGHDKGDDVLRGMAATFKESVRKEDIPARYGGEEFVIVLPDTSAEDALILAERVRESAEQTTYDFMDGKAATISVGVATFPLIKVENAAELVQAADQAMYKAKVSGKNKVVSSEPTGEETPKAEDTTQNEDKE